MATNRIGKLQTRRTDPLIKSANVYEVYDRIAEDESVKYAVGAMQPIEPEYTAATFAEGDRVKNQLDRILNPNGKSADFAYQGSVTSDTHIKAYSDIDLLTLLTKFHFIEPPGVPSFPYQGVPLEDADGMRETAAENLKTCYPTVDVDNEPGKCISLSGGSLRREVDVVVASWWDTVEYQQSYKQVDRGVMIYDSESYSWVKNKPFRHNDLLDAKDRRTAGNLRKVIRLLKSLKYDADTEVKVSSYDICSLAYRMPDDFLAANRGQELLLIRNIGQYLDYVEANASYRDLLMVPNEMRKIFCADGGSIEGLRQLNKEVKDLTRDIELGLRRSFKKLADARVSY